ncbi:hypothetical protein [Burkholderia sp. Bp8984]|uniref:hypothetical protein n=1 Tax=Burkholderia sp. Bp8984 TaxID=2184549 RepID=UPI000F5AF6B7|nr:hypothetical protein [Burkholderia sp. Bp8984]
MAPLDGRSVAPDAAPVDAAVGAGLPEFVDAADAPDAAPAGATDDVDVPATVCDAGAALPSPPPHAASQRHSAASIA